MEIEPTVRASWNSVSGKSFVYLIYAIIRGQTRIFYIGETRTGIFQRPSEHFSAEGTFLKNLSQTIDAGLVDTTKLEIWHYCIDRFVRPDDIAKRKAIEFMVERDLRFSSKIEGKFICRTDPNSYCDLRVVKNASTLAVNYFFEQLDIIGAIK